MKALILIETTANKVKEVATALKQSYLTTVAEEGQRGCEE